MLMLSVRTLRDALVLNHVSKGEPVIREKNRQNFNVFSSLVDTSLCKTIWNVQIFLKIANI